MSQSTKNETPHYAALPSLVFLPPS